MLGNKLPSLLEQYTSGDLFNANVPHRLRYLSPRPGLLVPFMKDTALLEKVHHWGQALRVCSPAPLPVCCLGFVIEDVPSQLSAPTAVIPTIIDSLCDRKPN